MKKKFTRQSYPAAVFIFSFLLSILLPYKSFAQNTVATIKVINKETRPVSYATVKMIPVTDSLHYIEKVTDSLGIAVFEATQVTRYKVVVTSVNYSMVQKGIIIKNSPAFFTILLENTTK